MIHAAGQEVLVMTGWESQPLFPLRCPSPARNFRILDRQRSAAENERPEWPRSPEPRFLPKTEIAPRYSARPQLATRTPEQQRRIATADLQEQSPARPA